MPQSAGFTTLSSNTLYDQFSTPVEHKLGQLFFSQIGQGYRFALAGASNLVIGNVIQSSAEDTNFKHMAIQAAVATTVSPSINGGYPIPITLGGTSTSTTSDFAGGTLSIDAGASQLGQTFTIIGNDVATNGTTCNFYVAEPPQVALTTSGFATAYHSPYWKVIQMPTAHTGIAVGGAVSAIVAAQYGFLQVLGPGSVLSDATVTAAATMGMSASVTTAGCATLAVNQDAQIGVSLSTVSVSARTGGIFWRCF